MKRRADASAGPAKRTRGGVRQRKESRRASEAVAGQSELALLLVTLFAWGDISPQMAQRLANAAYKDACKKAEGVSSLDDLKSIAEIGSSGFYPNKCYADLMSAMPFDCKIPEPLSCKLLFKQPLQWLSQAILLPHELFACIYTHFGHVWNKTIAPTSERLTEFWRTNSHHPAFAASRVKNIANYEKCVVPILLHGDDVPITGVGKSWSQSMTTFSWSSMIGLGRTKDMMYFIFGVFDKLRATNADQQQDTYGQFFTILSWSLHWLLEGQWPDRDWTGKKCLGFSLSRSFPMIPLSFDFWFLT